MKQKKIWKQKKILCMAAVLIFMAAAGTALAWLIAGAERINAFEAGETEIEIDETFEIPPELDPQDDKKNTITKKPTVKNTGNLACYVRMRADFSTSEMEEISEVDWNTGAADPWQDGGDGYYYYKELMPAGETTEPLFTRVKIKAKDKNGDDIQKEDLIDFDIYIYAEAVQDGEHPAGEHPDQEYLNIWKNYTGGGQQ